MLPLAYCHGGAEVGRLDLNCLKVEELFGTFSCRFELNCVETFPSDNLKMSGYRGGSVRDGQVYVGNLPPDIRTRDLEDLFYKYGKINFINLKDKNGPPFAFIEFDDPR